MSVETEQESGLEAALRMLRTLEGLEQEHSDWLEALDCWRALGYGEDLAQPEEEDGWEEERQTVWQYLERQALEGYDSSYVSEDSDPVLQWLESVLDIVTVWESRGSEEPERRGWEILLGYGGPSLGLELSVDGRASVWHAHWSAREWAHGELQWLANYLEELGL